MEWVSRGGRKLSSPSTAAPPQASSSGSKITPKVVIVIIILAVIFFLFGVAHLIFRLVVKRRRVSSSSATSSPQRNPRGLTGSEALQRQLQQLFHLHDSGLEQSVIDALPVFLYKELVGPKEPFDCAVCLCEFADDDKLRLLPACSHAFHINCIDTWLLSSSSCPLCRGGLFMPFDNPVSDLDEAREEEEEDAGVDREDARKSAELEQTSITNSDEDMEKMVFPVKLGKFKSLVSEPGDTGGDDSCVVVFLDNANAGIITKVEGESSSNNSSSRRSNKNIDARRCYSMGSYQYVEGDSILKVALSRNWDGRSGRRKGVNLTSGAEEGLPGKRLLVGSKGESFSVSKIWQWTSKKGRLPLSLDRASLEGGLPWTRKSGVTEGTHP